MSTQKEEHKLASGGNKRFIIPSQEAESAPVRSLFQAPSAVQPSCAVSSGSYADYIFNKEPKGPERRPAEQKPQGPNTGSELKPAIQAIASDLPQFPQIGKETSDSLQKLPTKVETRTEQNIENGKRDPVEVTISTTRPPSIASVKTLGGRSCIVVSTRQRGNPLLKHVRNIPWEFGDIVPDYLLGDTCCALFLSLRYHNLNPEYIHARLKSLGQSYALRVLLVQVDVKDPHFALKELAKICILSDLTLILSWSPEEAARYLETYKCYEQKPADALKEKLDADFMSRMTDCLTTIKSVNKTDSCTLLSTFGTLCDIANASREDLSLCPGLGPQKAKRLFDTLHEPFLKSKK